MNLPDAIQKASQILDEERRVPTVDYDAPSTASTTNAILASVALALRSTHPPQVQENPQIFQFKSVNFDLLCALLDQVHEQDRAALLGHLRSRLLDSHSYRHKFTEPLLGAGSSERCSSELPLVAEFLVRRGDTRLFTHALHEAAPSPGLTLLLLQLEEMIALNFTLFTDEEYAQLPIAIASIGRTVADLDRRPRPASTLESNTVHHVCREIPPLCSSVIEVCRKARYLYLKGSLLRGMNLEVNQDKDRVRAFLEKLGFTPLLIGSLNEAERL
jgi:hypothetical protein